MNSELVSIVTPCYNGAKYLNDFLNSILSQDYGRIELLFIDDGSTDDTKKIVKEYENEFLKKGYILKYFYQKNKGQAAAINVGLSNYSGEYFMWMDSDDILYSNSVSKKVEFLRNNKDCVFVFAKAEFVSEKDFDKRIRVVGTEPSNDLFSNYIFGHNVLFGPGSILVRASAIKECFGGKKIYESREGQNWQLMLPLAYNYKCGYIDDVLMKIVEHEDSHSRRKRTYRQEVKRDYAFCVLLENTILNIKNMPYYEKEKWIKIVKKKYYNKIYYRAMDNGDIWNVYKAGRSLKKMDETVEIVNSIIIATKIKVAKCGYIYRMFRGKSSNSVKLNK